MNERIRELFLQAGFHPPVVKRMGDEYKFEKFADLIVRECVNVLSTRKDHSVIINSIKEVKEHFGVEK